jgi:hypothetical protein
MLRLREAAASYAQTVALTGKREGEQQQQEEEIGYLEREGGGQREKGGGMRAIRMRREGDWEHMEIYCIFLR